MNQYLDLMASVGELQGLCKGLLAYHDIPEEIRVRLSTRLTSINSQVATFLESPKDFPETP